MKKVFGKYYDLFAGSKYVLFLNISDRLYSLIVLLLIARNFSALEYGEIITILTFAMIIQIIFDLGLPSYLQRETAVNFYEPSHLFSIVFIFTLILIPLYIGISYTFKLFLYPETDITLFFIIFVFIYEASLINICNKVLSGKNDFKSQFTAFIVSRLYIIIFSVIGIYSIGFDLVSLMLIILSGFFLNFILIFLALGKHNIQLRFSSFRFSKLKPVLKAAIPLGLAVIFNFLYDKIDVLLISKMKDFYDVAFYNIGYGIYKSASLGFSFLLVAGFTKISSLNNDKSAIKEFFKDYLKIISIICVVISVLLFILSGPLVDFLYTKRYSEASLVIKILAFGFTGMGLNNLTGITLNGMGYFKAVMYITLYGLIVNVLLNIFFIPFYGIKAASVITVLTEYIIFAIQYYHLRRILG